MNIGNKKFVASFLVLFFAMPPLAMVLNKKDVNIVQNDLIRKHQLKKIAESSNFDTIFIGDSSVGNAINSKYFDSIAGTKSLNLALTSSFGIESSINMMKRAIEKNPRIKNVALVQIMDIWNRRFSFTGYFDTLVSQEYFETYSKITNESTIKKYFEFLINPREIYWYLKFLMGKRVERKLDLENDFLLQTPKKYSNGKKKAKSFAYIDPIFKSDVEQNVYKVFVKFCEEKKLNCMFMSGTLHKVVHDNSQESIDKLADFLEKESRSVKYSAKVLNYPPHMMGDSKNHVDTKFKNQSTEDFYNEMKNIGFL